jgi:hypothetical protein
LALELGKTVAEIETMSSHEISEWIAYNRIDPLGREQRGDLRAGIVASVIANSHRTRGAAYTPQDFLPFPAERKPKVAPSPVEAVQAFKRLIAGAKNG